MSATSIDHDPLQARLATNASGLLREFNQVGVLAAADVHVARRLASLTGERDEAVALAVALAVRGPRLGHVHVDLARIRHTAAVEAEEPVDLEALAWPDPEDWISRVARSPLVAAGELSPEVRPLRLSASRLYLDRYWAEEVEVSAALLAMASDPPPSVDEGLLAAGLERLFAGEADGLQARAAAAAVRRRLAVVAGGPGTGKTTTVARIVALLAEQTAAGLAAHSAAGLAEQTAEDLTEQSAAGRPPLIALAAPTGKAAARLQEAVHAEAEHLDVSDEVTGQLLSLEASTLHRLLGRRPGSDTRFRHDRQRRLPHDVVIVDETSMVSLSLMARLIEALRSSARLVLVGDPGQLASIEAGAVLGDIVGPMDSDRPAGAAPISDGPASAAPISDGPASPAPTGDRPASAAPTGDRPAQPPPIARGIVVLRHVHRFGGAIAELARAIHAGDAGGTMQLLQGSPEDIAWIDADLDDDAALGLLGPVRDSALGPARAVIETAAAGAAREALAELGAFRILCAHRRGPYGVAGWTARMESWLQDAADAFVGGERWYAGRPLLVVENDYELGLYNGDTGVVVRGEDGRLVAAFARGDQIVEYTPARLGAVETVYAMTIHKSQGSQFDAAAVLLPEPGARILTRELLYTAVTRARRRLIVVGTEDAIRTGVQRPVARASGLRRRLWGQD
jgi:exodeoxyribonuclease V alpha subunit